MNKVTLEFLTEQLNLGEQLIAGRNSMFEPQDLPGRFGLVIREIDRVLEVIDCEAVVGGGLASRVFRPYDTGCRYRDTLCTDRGVFARGGGQWFRGLCEKHWPLAESVA